VNQALSDTGISNPPAVSGDLLKDIVIPNLPSPYYHFEYDGSGRVLGASFASGARNYSLTYVGGRLSAMQNNNGANQDRLDYVYDDAGRVALVKYVDAGGTVYTTVFLSYSGSRLTELERDRRVTGGFIIDKTKLNVDGFSLIHTEFGDHLVLLPGVQLQKGNPGRVTRTGDGVNYIINYTYSYDGNRPLSKSGDSLFTNGSDAGTHFQTLSQFSYY
jgi:hypothetical protein